MTPFTPHQDHLPTFYHQHHTDYPPSKHYSRLHSPSSSPPAALELTSLPDKTLHRPSSPDSSSSSLSSTTNKNTSSHISKPASLRYKTYHTAFGPLSINHFMRKDWIKFYIILVILLILVTIVAIFHNQIVKTLHPYAESVKNLKINDVQVGWIIPVIILFIISFPPLFGHEIVIILCGLVWGLWIGFLIAAAGTLLGEVANYFAFKYACTHRASKLEKKDLNYACMCRVIREGGFRIALLARLSTIPGHLVTPVFATTGMSLFIFTAATVISMPKQMAGVYLGTLFSEEGDGLPKSGSSQAVKYSVLAVSFIVTVVAALYIYQQMAKVRKEVQDQIDNGIINRNSNDNTNLEALSRLPSSSDHLSSLKSNPNPIIK